MRFGSFIAALAASLTIIPAAQAQTPEALSTNAPHYFEAKEPWDTQPGIITGPGAYPSALQAALKSAYVIVECHIAGGGNLEGCAPIIEEPKGLGAGEAAVRLIPQRRVKQFAADGTPTAGLYALVPFHMRIDGTARVLDKYLPGEPAYLLSPQKGSRNEGTAPCPTAEKPKRQCFAHRVFWESKPPFEVLAPLVRGVGRTSGVTSASCLAGPGGALRDCVLTDTFEGAQAIAMDGLLKGLRAPAKSTGDVAIGDNRIVVQFSWPDLLATVNASAVGQVH